MSFTVIPDRICPIDAHHMSIEGEGSRPTRAHVTALGRRHGLSTRMIVAIIETVQAAVADWPQIADDVGVAASRTDIDGRWKHVATTFA